MIIVSENGEATRTNKIGAEPFEDVFAYQLVLDALEESAREFIHARDNGSAYLDRAVKKLAESAKLVVDTPSGERWLVNDS